MFKNKAEREKFLREYRNWQSIQGSDQNHFNWHGITLNFYRYEFKNGATVIVTDCPRYHDGKFEFETRYNLIIPEGDGYNPYDMHSGCTPSEFRGYNLQGVSVGTIVDYMTKRKEEI